MKNTAYFLKLFKSLISAISHSVLSQIFSRLFIYLILCNYGYRINFIYFLFTSSKSCSSNVLFDWFTYNGLIFYRIYMRLVCIKQNTFKSVLFFLISGDVEIIKELLLIELCRFFFCPTKKLCKGF